MHVCVYDVRVVQKKAAIHDAQKDELREAREEVHRLEALQTSLSTVTFTVPNFSTPWPGALKKN